MDKEALWPTDRVGGWMDLFNIKYINIVQIYIRYKYKVH